MPRGTTAGSPACGGPPGRPEISIIIPNHNYGRFLSGCLQSILAQSVNPKRVEVIFVDDASSDGSLELARELLPSMPFAGHRILSLPRQGRPGPVRNAGLAQAKGNALLTLDPDDELLPDFLTRCLEALDHGADVAYTDYMQGEGGEWREVRLGGYHKFLLANQNILSPALFRRVLWDRGARYRADTLYEDWDFWIQLALKRARFAHVAQPLYLYRMHEGSFSTMARQDDALSKARLVLENAGFFPSWTQAWARDVLRRDPCTDPMPRGIIPILPDHATRRLPLEPIVV